MQNQIKRLMKRLGARYLPESIKSRFRSRLYGFRPSRTRLGVREAQEGSQTRFCFENGLEIILPQSAQEEFRFHCFTNGENQEELGALLSVARSPGVLFDVGAHQGVVSLLYCASNPENTSFAYEPSPGSIQIGRNTLKINGLMNRVEYVEAAVGDRVEDRLVWFPDDGFMSLAPSTTKTAGTPTRFLTLDSEVDRIGKQPTVVKIDVEGFEWEVLQGSVEVLRVAKPLVFLELHLDLLEKRGISPVAVCNMLADLGYALYDCVGNPLPLSAGYNGFSALRRFIWQHEAGVRWTRS